MEAPAGRADQMAASPACCPLPLEGPLDLAAVADSVADERYLEDPAVLEAVVRGEAEAVDRAAVAADSRKAAYLAVEEVEAAAGAVVAEDVSDARR